MSNHAFVSLNNATYGGIYYCSDFTTSGAQPTWTKLTTTGLANLECTHFRVDWDDPLNKHFVRLSNEWIYYRNGGNWTKVLDHTIAAAAAAESAVNSWLRHLWTDPTTPGSVYCTFMSDPAPTQSGNAYVMKSLDYGATWTAHQYATGRAFIGAVEVIGNHIWASAGKLIIAASSFNYSNDGGANWKGITLNAAGSASTAAIRINPHAGNQAWLFGDGANNYWTWAAGYTSRIPASDPAISGFCDGLWFDPVTAGRMIICNPDSAIYWSDDYFVTSNTTTQTSGGVGATRKRAITGPTNQGSSLALVYGLNTDTAGHAAGYLSSHLDVSAENRAGTNTAAPPYTDAIPQLVAVSEYGIWWGSPPADKGVLVFSVEEDDITDIPDPEGLGIPLFGDRSSWRDFDADEDLNGTPLADYHAQDIQEDTPQRHAPWSIPAPGAGYGIVSDGAKWVISSDELALEGDLHDPVTLDVDAATILDLQGAGGQEIGLDVQAANTVLAGPTSGAANEPTFRALALVNGDISDIDVTGVADGDTLIYDLATTTWLPGTGIDVGTLHGHIINEDHSAECTGAEDEFATDYDFLITTTAVYLNGLRQRLNTHYTEDAGLNGITMDTPPEAGDELVIDYIISYADWLLYLAAVASAMLDSESEQLQDSEGFLLGDSL